ncbi:MAG: septum formation initiator family protein [Victivallales bacterium]|nr:septum formation initiator family protein [Victivallales bacterium]
MPVRKEMNMKKANLEQLKIENAALDKELRELRKEYTRLENKDPYSLLRVARETYDYCFPNEKIYQFPKHSSHTDADMLPTDTLQPSTN